MRSALRALRKWEDQPMIKGLGLSVAAVGLALGFAAPASAAGNIYVDNVGLAFYSAGTAETVTLTGDIDGATTDFPGTSLAGQILLTVNNGTSALPAAERYVLPVWCVDLFHDIVLGSNGEQFSEGALGTDNSPNPSLLSAMQKTDILALATYGNHLMAQTATDNVTTSTVVQAAIWTVEYNSSFGGAPGVNNTLLVTGAFTATAITDMISAAIKWGGNGGQLISLLGVQQQVFDAPEPASLALLGASLLAIGVLRRRTI
jgi:hypothetical protein